MERFNGGLAEGLFMGYPTPPPKPTHAHSRAWGTPPPFRKFAPANSNHHRGPKPYESESKPWKYCPQVSWGLPPMNITVLLRFC